MITKTITGVYNGYPVTISKIEDEYRFRLPEYPSLIFGLGSAIHLLNGFCRQTGTEHAGDESYIKSNGVIYKISVTNPRAGAANAV